MHILAFAQFSPKNDLSESRPRAAETDALESLVINKRAENKNMLFLSKPYTVSIPPTSALNYSSFQTSNLSCFFPSISTYFKVE